MYMYMYTVLIVWKCWAWYMYLRSPLPLEFRTTVYELVDRSELDGSFHFIINSGSINTEYENKL